MPIRLASIRAAVFVATFLYAQAQIDLVVRTA